MTIARRDFLRLTAAALPALTGLSGRAHGAPDAVAKPNIVLVMADDQGWGDMAYQGHPVLKTPNFDDMAAKGLRFDRFYAAAPVCSPTRGSVMTGRHPNRFGCFSWGGTLRPQEITVAEALKTAGYATGHFGKWHLGSVRKDSPVNPGASGFDTWFSAPNFFDNDPIMSREGVAVPSPGESSMVTVDAALSFMEERVESKEPFLAVVWFGSPHSPHRALDNDRAVYADKPDKFQNFYGEITAMDRAFGKLRDALGRLGIRDNTLLWYCSDNGGLPGVGRTGHRGHKGQIYEGGLLVPALIEWPGRVKAPRRTDVRCNTCDIYPTLLDITGVSMPEQPPLDGISLLPLFADRLDSRPTPMGFWHRPGGSRSTPSAKWMQELYDAQQAGHEPEDEDDKRRLDAGQITTRHAEDTFPGHSAWIDGEWKLHRIHGKKGAIKFELYNLASDPQEKEDLAATETDRVTTMQAALEIWLRAVVGSLNGADYASL